MKNLIIKEKVRRRKLTTQYEAIVFFISQLDIEMVEAFLDEKVVYQNFSKSIFIGKLNNTFKQFEQEGNRILTVHKGSCEGCSKGCKGFTFLGSKGHYMDLLFLQDKGKIKDIYECHNFITKEKDLKKSFQLILTKNLKNDD